MGVNQWTSQSSERGERAGAAQREHAQGEHAHEALTRTSAARPGFALGGYMWIQIETAPMLTASLSSALYACTGTALTAAETRQTKSGGHTA